MRSMYEMLSGIEKRFRARAIPVVRAVANPPAGSALLWVDQLSGALKLKRADGTTTTYSAGGGSSGPATQIRESSGPTTLTVGAVSDGQVLKRVGSTVIGAFVAVALVCVDDGGDAFSDPSNVLTTAVVVVAAGAPS